jgi:hypothetical protein
MIVDSGKQNLDSTRFDGFGNASDITATNQIHQGTSRTRLSILQRRMT